jgi:hypothetical protein
MGSEKVLPYATQCDCHFRWYVNHMAVAPDILLSYRHFIWYRLDWDRLHTTRKPMKQLCHRWSLRRACWTKQRDLILSPIQWPVQVQ